MLDCKAQWPLVEDENSLEEALLKKPEGVIIKADEDGMWQKHLSPRFNPEPFEKRLADFVAFVEKVKTAMPHFAVSLCVEELCPGGLDATDGIAIARAVEKCGACAIIASGGTDDFPMLKHRRPTHNKHSHENFETNEPWLATALWLVGRITLPIYAKGDVQNLQKAHESAKNLGLAGIWH